GIPRTHVRICRQLQGHANRPPAPVPGRDHTGGQADTETGLRPGNTGSQDAVVPAERSASETWGARAGTHAAVPWTRWVPALRARAPTLPSPACDPLAGQGRVGGCGRSAGTTLLGERVTLQ